MDSEVRKLQSILLSTMHVGQHEFFRLRFIIASLALYGTVFFVLIQNTSQPCDQVFDATELLQLIIGE